MSVPLIFYTILAGMAFGWGVLRKLEEGDFSYERPPVNLIGLLFPSFYLGYYITVVLLKRLF